MAKHYQSPTLIKAAGNKPKTIEEYFGRVNSGDSRLSIARMKSPPGWIEPGQTPEFDEYTIVLKGSLMVETGGQTFNVVAGEAILIEGGEWVKYSSPEEEGAATHYL